MQTFTLEIIDNITFEVVEEVEININDLKKITVLTSDLECTKVVLTSKD